MNASPPATGTKLDGPVVVVVPSPSWPASLIPAQYASRLEVTPQVWSPPALTTVKLSPPVLSSTGVGPSRSPQQYHAPFVDWPHERVPPTVTLVKLMSPRPGTGLVPQQYTLPPSATPHV